MACLYPISSWWVGEDHLHGEGKCSVRHPPQLTFVTHWYRRKVMTAHSVSTGDRTTPWDGLNCLGSRGCPRLGKDRPRNGCGQSGPVLRKTEPASEVCCPLGSCFSALHLPAP